MMKRIPNSIGRTITFTSSGTYIPPAPNTLVLVRMVAGGGGGASYGATNGAGGGGAGETAEGMFLLTDVTPISVTIGAKGDGGTSSGAGADGGDTSFGSYLTALGGKGGGSTTRDKGGYGGGHKPVIECASVSLGLTGLRGVHTGMVSYTPGAGGGNQQTDGGDSIRYDGGVNGGAYTSRGGGGGASEFGDGGNGGNNGVAGSNAAANTGAGGGGSGKTADQGGDGASGKAEIYEIARF